MKLSYLDHFFFSQRISALWSSTTMTYGSTYCLIRSYRQFFPKTILPCFWSQSNKKCRLKICFSKLNPECLQSRHFSNCYWNYLIYDFMADPLLESFFEKVISIFICLSSTEVLSRICNFQGIKLFLHKASLT